MSSVLAKLMHIDKPSISHTTHQKEHRVLSENYFQNIASITKRDKVFPLSDDSDIEIDVGEDFPCRTQNSVHGRRSFSSSKSSFIDQKRRNSFSEQSKGTLIREKRSSNFCNDMESSIRNSLSSQEIAKQITGQVKHSLWHNCAELSSSKSTSEKSSENKEEGRITPFTRSFDSELEHEDSSFSSLKGSTSTETQKSENSLSWRTRNCSKEVRKSQGSKIEDEVLVWSSNGSSSITNTSDGNGRRVITGARYLAKPTIFPSTWVPRSKVRRFTLDKSWSSKPGMLGTKQWVDSKEETKVQSISQSCSCDLDSEKRSNHREASLCEEISTLSGFLSDKSEFSDIGSTSVHENETSHSEEEVIDEGNEKMNMSTKFRKENLLGNEDSFSYQLKNKNNTREPRSPVSSLEGPEDHSHSLHLIVQAAEYFSVSDCFENDAQGLQNKLQVIETLSLESGSEGPEMIVSSEGDDISSVETYQNDPQIEMYQTFVKECWDFSYVVDVVVESGLEARNLEIKTRDLQLQNYVINPSVFGSLEKKYGKSMPWERSERRLLFDRLSSGLFELVRPSFDLNTWRKPIVERLFPKEKSKELEEELWSMLVKQKQDLERGSSDKVYRNEIDWLDLEEDTNLIVNELESLMLDEVVEEFVRLEIYCF